jgi:hypothetical protein
MVSNASSRTRSFSIHSTVGEGLPPTQSVENAAVVVRPDRPTGLPGNGLPSRPHRQLGDNFLSAGHGKQESQRGRIPRVFRHVGLLFNEAPGTAGLPFNNSSENCDRTHRQAFGDPGHNESIAPRRGVGYRIPHKNNSKLSVASHVLRHGPRTVSELRGADSPLAASPYPGWGCTPLPSASGRGAACNSGTEVVTRPRFRAQGAGALSPGLFRSCCISQPLCFPALPWPSSVRSSNHAETSGNRPAGVLLPGQGRFRGITGRVKRES